MRNAIRDEIDGKIMNYVDKNENDILVFQVEVKDLVRT